MWVIVSKGVSFMYFVTHERVVKDFTRFCDKNSKQFYFGYGEFSCQGFASICVPIVYAHEILSFGTL
jgi:hypothetical protein